MPFNISKLSDQTLSKEKCYFLDANVWVFTLGAISSPNKKELIYIDFAENLLLNEFQIWSHSLVFSEVFNALIRNSFSDFKNQLLTKETNPRERIGKFTVKRDFRGTPEYHSAFERIKSDVQAYVPNLEFLDKAYDLDFKYISQNYPSNSDFNDYLYYEMAIDKNLTLVTDDGDFSFSDVEILTENQFLLKNSK